MENNREFLFTIAIVSYNHSKYLLRNLSACKEQTFEDYEIVFLDNCSTDNSVEIASDFFRQNPNIPVTIVDVEKNLGAGPGRVAAAHSSNGKYIIFVDSDDFLEPDALFNYAESINETDYDAVYAYKKEVDENYNIVLRPTIKNPHSSKWMNITLQGACFKTEIFRRASGNIDNMFFEDLYLSLLFSKASGPAVWIDKVTYNYRINHTSRSSVSVMGVPGRIPAAFVELIELLVGFESGLADEDMMIYRYTLLRVYYSCIFNCRTLSLRAKFEHYRMLNHSFNEFYPGYLKRMELSFDQHYHLSFKNKIRLSFKLEKIDSVLGRHPAMYCLLIAYHTADKIGLYNKPLR
ncbi:hypothetical protein AGMMS49983_09400 [Clostridia bacterium]|nr:hypothetical protein AGMMS49983_09400 [Clostridia bacterium]